MPNNPPFFTDGLGPKDIEVRINREIFYPFPSAQDPELQPILIAHTRLPSFVTFDGNNYDIFPISIDGKFQVDGSISDGTYNVSFSFFIYVVN